MILLTEKEKIEKTILELPLMMNQVREAYNKGNHDQMASQLWEVIQDCQSILLAQARGQNQHKDFMKQCRSLAKVIFGE